MTAIKDHDKTGNVTLIDPKPAVDPWPIITDEARTAWDEAQAELADGYPECHALVTEWYVTGWEAANDKPAIDWVKAVNFNWACWVGRCWECDWPPSACGCGHHRPGSWVPAGPVKPADPLPAVAAFLGIAKPAPEAEPVTEEPAPAAEPEPAPVAAPEPAAGEPGPATDATAVLVDIAEKQEAAKEPDDATKVIAVADAHTEAVPVVKDEEASSDE